MPDFLPSDIQLLSDQMGMLVAEQLRPLEEELSPDPRVAIPDEIAQLVRQRSHAAGMW